MVVVLPTAGCWAGITLAHMRKGCGVRYRGLCLPSGSVPAVVPPLVRHAVRIVHQSSGLLAAGHIPAQNPRDVIYNTAPY
jgi:hypothetical protein